ncbi:phosphatase PAP2 family protein [Aquabacterium lacunae]|uniref:Phosphatase PAP2 family protein n=1 Tax=Aquabacterium lacunae TaxID=2528630 RepID=A0A4Q9H1Q0_9BURK|nr:phosphatase PAP2 family protein [Aquabacterium lacunae]TBO34099.1 phosphatase PAP2 family protein [Aquabacterium lacunae]
MTTDTIDSTERDTRLIWAGLFLCVAVFLKVPAIDLWVSAHYWRPETGFFQRHNPVVVALYDATPWVGNGLVVLMLVVALAGPWLARRAAGMGRAHWAEHLRGTWRRTAVAGLCVAVLSSGLAVELGLKKTMGRPRPVQTVEFGGTQPFHALFKRGPTPSKHKSFPSGHAAAGFSLMVLGLFASPLWRRRWLLIGLVAGGAVGMARILQGGHYLSDVIGSFYMVWLSCELVAWGFRRYDLSRLPAHHPDRMGQRRAIR